MKQAATIRKEITAWVEAEVARQGVPWYRCDRTEWEQCPLIVPGCPEDLCILPAGHVGTEEGYHVLGTVAYSHAVRFPKEWLRPRGTTVEELYAEGVKMADELWPRD